MNVSVIVITLNEAGSIPRVLQEIPKDAVDEILVVDGHSTDGTPEIVRKSGHNVIPEEGKGFGMAYITGARHAKGDTLIFTTGDGSQDPKDIPKLIAKMKEGYKVVLASRYAKGGSSEDDTPITFIGNKCFTFITNLLHGTRVSDSLYMYAAIDKKTFFELDLKYPSFEFCVEVPIKAHRKGHKIGEVPVHERKRFHGTKKVNEFLDGLKILRAIIREAFV